MRLGYAAKGLVYVLVGALALAVAIGLADRVGGSAEVLALVADLPLGRGLLALLALGLLGYAALSLAAAVRDCAPAALLTRVAEAATGVIYLGLTVVALRLVVDPASRSERLGGRLVDVALASSHGAWLLGATGTALLVLGAFLLVRALAWPGGTSLDRRLLGERAQRWVAALGRTGSAVRGAFFAFCGVLVLDAARNRDASAIRDVGEALGALARQPAGPFLLTLVALGFIAYGAYQLAKARFRRLDLL